MYGQQKCLQYWLDHNILDALKYTCVCVCVTFFFVIKVYELLCCTLKKSLSVFCKNPGLITTTFSFMQFARIKLRMESGNMTKRQQTDQRTGFEHSETTCMFSEFY